jgi:hypothetical protein
MDPLLLCDGIDGGLGWDLQSDLDVRVSRGEESRIPVTAHNPGTAEEHYRFEILGDVARWARIEPRYVPGVPGGGQTRVELVLRPPVDAPAGTTPFAVRCVSLADPNRCAVVEGDVVVGASRDVDVAVTPVTAAGRRSGHYLVTAANRGRAPAQVRLSGSDPRRELGFAVVPGEFTLEGGETETSYVSVRPRHPKLLGGTVSHPFVVEHRGPSGAVDRLPQRFEQRPVLGALTGTLAALLVLGIVALGGLLAWPSLHHPGAATAASSAPASGNVLHRSYVVWAATPVADLGNQGAPARLVAKLQAAGIAARIVDTRTSPQLAQTAQPAYLVVQDGFADVAAAQAACTAHRDIAPACFAVPG